MGKDVATVFQAGAVNAETSTHANIFLSDGLRDVCGRGLWLFGYSVVRDRFSLLNLRLGSPVYFFDIWRLDPQALPLDYGLTVKSWDLTLRCPHLGPDP